MSWERGPARNRSAGGTGPHPERKGPGDRGRRNKNTLVHTPRQKKIGAGTVREAGRETTELKSKTEERKEGTRGQGVKKLSRGVRVYCVKNSVVCPVMIRGDNEGN